MRMFILLAVAVAVAAIGFGVKTIFTSGERTTVASKTLSPHDIHLNYKAMKELPVHEVKDAF